MPNLNIMLDLQNRSHYAFSQEGFRNVFSLDSLLAFWETEEKTNASGLAVLAASLNRQVEQLPELRGIVDDPLTLTKHNELLRSLFSAVMPAGLKALAFSGISAPGKWEFHWSTPRFQEELLDEQGGIRGELCLDGLSWEYLTGIFGYLGVLRHCYGVERAFQKSVLIRVVNPSNRLARTFQIRAQFDMLEIQPIGELPVLDLERISEVSVDMTSLETWRALVPAERFEFKGFMVIAATDVTEESTRSRLKDVLIEPQPLSTRESFQAIEDLMRTLLTLPNLSLGVVGIEGGSAFGMDGKVGFEHQVETDSVCELICKNCRSELFQGQEVMHHDLKEVEMCSPLMARLREGGTRSFLMLPLFSDGELLGALCLMTDVPSQLSSLTKLRLKGITELFALALGRTLDSVQNEIQAAMKAKFTAIHPCVEWSFRAAALSYVRHGTVDDVVFPDVFSLYASSDIRSSSDLRNEAIRGDLLRQIQSAKRVLELAENQSQISYLQTLIFRLDRLASELSAGVRTGDEQRIAQVLSTEIDPVFDSVDHFSPEVHESVEGYRNAVCSQSGELHQKRRNYEDSVDDLARHLTNIMGEEQVKAQKVFPHLFEMYRTDGVEHSIYIGNSLTEREDFSSLYLNELRLWQLRVVCRLAQESHRMRSILPQPLEVAHLILAQSDSIGLRYSQDEKKFNVDGAYNVRYEIIKKRIDKAVIKGTGQRLTQPGQIALVYSLPSEERDYRLYFDFLQQQGLLESGIERLELEDLQGVYGLKALRVAVVLDGN